MRISSWTREQIKLAAAVALRGSRSAVHDVDFVAEGTEDECSETENNKRCFSKLMY